MFVISHVVFDPAVIVSSLEPPSIGYSNVVDETDKGITRASCETSIFIDLSAELMVNVAVRPSSISFASTFTLITSFPFDEVLEKLHQLALFTISQLVLGSALTFITL